MGTVRYTVLNGEVIAEKRNGVRRQYVPDPLGSTVALLDNTQAQTDTFDYWPYGEESNRTGTTATPFRYVGTRGQYRDSSTRDYARARIYMMKLAQFLSVVSLNEQLGTEHPYGYAMNNPVNYVDPDGNAPDNSLAGSGYPHSHRPGDGSLAGPQPPRPSDGCFPEDRRRISAALRDLCKNRIHLMTDHKVRECATRMCSKRLLIKCRSERDPQCSVNASSYPGYTPLPGFAGSGSACSFSRRVGDPPDTINLCPSAFTGSQGKGCGCLGSTILWEMLNNCDTNRRNSDSPLCPQSNLLYAQGTVVSLICLGQIRF